jgi:hypothetical protein
MSVADELEKLARLLEQGAITQDEFDQQKAQLLAQPTAPARSESPIPAPAPQPPPKPGKMSALAVLAFVFAFLVGPLGVLLGIAAIIVIGVSKGKTRGLGFAIASIPIGLAFGSIWLAVAIPAFVNYGRRAKTSEATLNIDRIFEGAVTYYEAEHVQRGLDGVILTHQLPASTDWTPAVPCCEQTGAKCSAAAAIEEWETSPTWRGLNFAMGDDFYYQYRFVVEDDIFYAQARGDLDCDGDYSFFERAAQITPEKTIQGSSGVYKKDPLE